jgi:hypothetical protein
MTFPNGFTSWYETHHEIVSMIALAYEHDEPNMVAFVERRGTGGLYEMGFLMTQEFEQQHAGRQWDGEFFEELEHYFAQKIEELYEL